MEEQLRAAIQNLVDSDGEGWTLGQYVLVMGLERMNPDHTMESTPWYWAPPDQPEWQTGGLLERAVDMHNSPYDED